MHSELAVYQSQIELLIAFAEGRLDGAALDDALATQEMEDLLRVFEDPRYPSSTNDHRRLLAQNRVTLGGLVNSEGIIERFLQYAQVDFQAAKRYQSLYALVLSALLDYVDPPLEFLTEKIVPTDSALSASQKKKLIRERLKQYFRYLAKPPQWIQNPNWPIRDGTPLVFVGQVAIPSSEIFHDAGAAYVFVDAEKGFETIAQFY